MAELSNTVVAPSTMTGTLALGFRAGEGRQVLLALTRVHGNRLVGQAGFFQEQRHLHGVGGKRVVELQHGGDL
jgi:hypothetical protein